MASPRNVCVVDGSTRAVASLGETLDSVSVASVTVDEAMVVLCRAPVDCLVVPADLDGPDPTHLAHAARGLYPDLPVVIFGTDLPTAPDDLVTVTGESLTDDAVVQAIGETLAANPDPKSGREPSRPETMLASMFEGYPVHLYAKDTHARHLITSDYLIRPGDLLGLTDMETLSGDETYDEANYTDDRQVIEEGEPVLEIDEYADSAGLFLRSSKVPWRDSSGEILGLVGITQDVTELREQKEQLRRRNRRLRKVALMSAHELRNELQVLTGHCSQIEGADTHTKAAKDSIQHLTGVVDKIVSMATYNETEREPTTLWLSALARDVWEGQATPDATLTLDGDRRLLGDRDATLLLVELLLDNAVVHCGPSVSVEVGATDDGFYVADDGPGIPFEIPERALEPAITSADGGSGFGLYIAQQLATEQGWVIEVSNPESGGARFDVTGVDAPE